MRSSVEDPANPWPHDMVITVNDDRELEYLLFVRAAWDLDIDEVYPVEPGVELGSSRRPDDLDARIAVVRWLGAWSTAWRAAAEIPSPDRFAPRRSGALSSPYFGRGIDREAYEAWRWRLRTGEPLVPLDESPERMSLPALILAWRSGLTTILELPVTGDFAQRVSDSHLVVSRQTRRDPARFTSALASRPAR